MTVPILSPSSKISMKTLFGPLPLKYCAIFMWLAGFSLFGSIVYIVSLVGALINHITSRGLKVTSFGLQTSAVALLIGIQSLLAYFIQRMFYNMCTGEM